MLAADVGRRARAGVRVTAGMTLGLASAADDTYGYRLLIIKETKTPVLPGYHTVMLLQNLQLTFISMKLFLVFPWS